MSVEQQTAQILREIHDPSRAGGAPAERLVFDCSAAAGSIGTSLTWCVADAAPLTIAATPGVGLTLERLSFVVGESPQSSSVSTNRIVLRPFLDDGRAEWPGFTPEALRLGVRAVFAFPLRLGAINLGVLTLYRAVPGSLADDELGSALAYTAAATALLLDSGSGDHPEDLPAVLEDPFALQAEVHQATGMLAVQLSIELSAALSLIRAHAYSTEATIDSVARSVVARRLFIT